MFFRRKLIAIVGKSNQNINICKCLAYNLYTLNNFLFQRVLQSNSPIALWSFIPFCIAAGKNHIFPYIIHQYSTHKQTSIIERANMRGQITISHLILFLQTWLLSSTRPGINGKVSFV
jgi:hypothetical protein